MSEHHQEGLAHLLYGINQGGGFVALTGEVGTGKTTLCHCLLQQLPDNIDIALVFNPKLTAIELLATICDELHIHYDDNKQTLKYLIDLLNQHLLTAYSAGRRTVLLIDEAQNLSFNVLEQIRLLTNLETSTAKLLQIILVGQPELKALLARPELRQLNQRITARYHLNPLSLAETQDYIQHRLKLSGGSEKTFNRRMVKKVYRLSNGIPRLINILCDRALLGCYVTGNLLVTEKIINKAAEEVFSEIYPKKGLMTKWLLLSLVLLTSAIVVYKIISDKEPEKHIVLQGTFNKTIAEELVQTIEVETIEPVLGILPVNLTQYLSKQGLSLDIATIKLAGLWNKSIVKGDTCKQLKALNLMCLFDKSDWKNLIALNRPVIMEFTVESQTVYAVLQEMEKGQVTLMTDTKHVFPVEQIMALWEGYYLMLWQPPFIDNQQISPGQSNGAVLWVKTQLGMQGLESKLFNQHLKSAVIDFQKIHHLKPDGIVGPRTFIQLSNQDINNKAPKLKLEN